MSIPVRRRLLRLSLRGAAVLGGLALLAMALTLFGWRYGFTPLPKPDPGGALPNPYAITEDDLRPEHAWYWGRQAQRILQARSISRAPLDRFVSSYVAFGLAAATNRGPVAAWIANHPGLSDAYAGVLTAPNTQAPDWSSAPEGDEMWCETTRRTLVQLALWQAAEAERTNAIPEAFRHLMDGWHIDRQLSRDGIGAMSGQLAVVWRRLALQAPLPPVHETAQLMARLTDWAEPPPSLEAVFARSAWRNITMVLSKNPDAASYRAAYGVRFPGILDILASAARQVADRLIEIGEFARDLIASVFDGSRPRLEPFSPIEAAKALRQDLAQQVQVAVTRTGDLALMHQAFVRGVAARIRAGDTAAAIEWSEALRRGRSSWRASFDRPLVWQVPARCESAACCLERIRWWQLSIESSRLTFALRIWREAHGGYPNSLEELEPAVMARLPRDPFSGKPFLYRLLPDGYIFASIGPDNSAPQTLLSTNLHFLYQRQRHVFASAEPAQALAQWRTSLAESGTRRPMIMDPRLLMRYGLLPKGFKLPYPDALDAPAPQTLTHLLPVTNATDVPANAPRP